MKRGLCTVLVLFCSYVLASKAVSFDNVHFQRATAAADTAHTSLLRTEPVVYPGAEIRLDVPYISQLPELRNGCEITSSAMLLRYCGFSVDKCTLADDYLPKLYPYITADPEEGYMGDPYTVWGYYCMTKPIVTAINDYLTEQAAPLWQAEDISGVSVDELQTYIARGFPVQAWVTIDFEEPTYYDTFLLPNGSQPYANLHCIVLTGMSETGFYIHDPLRGAGSVTFADFEAAFTALGNRAVYIRKDRD